MARAEAAMRAISIPVGVGLAIVCAAHGDAKASELIYSPWDRFCFNDLCFVGSSISLPIKCNPVVAATVLIERTGESKNTLRITLPNVRVEDGVRISIDGERPESLAFQKCFSNGCTADDEAGLELVDRLKNGTILVIEATSAAGAPMIYKLPLAGFAAAYDGPPLEPKVFEEQPKKLREELQARAEGKQRPQEKKKVECGEEPK
jgi:invasion protein IalB